MSYRVRILSGPHAGREGMPHERTEAGKYSVRFDDDEVIWFDKDQISTLYCEVLNCRAYSDNPGHEYCQKCRARRAGRPAPSPETKPEPSNFLQDILKLGAMADEKSKELDEVMEVMKSMKRGDLPRTRATIQRLRKQLWSIMPTCFDSESQGTFEEVVKDLEALVIDREEK